MLHNVYPSVRQGVKNSRVAFFSSSLLYTGIVFLCQKGVATYFKRFEPQKLVKYLKSH